MNERDLLREMAKANFHKEGLRALQLFRVDGEFFSRLKVEVQSLVESERPSAVSDAEHITAWTKPFGKAVQFSLLNATGDFHDTSVDHNSSIKGKRFHHSERFPTLGRFIEAFPHATNMRLNGLNPQSGLSPHEEHPVSRQGDLYTLRGRFHLPVETSLESEMVLDGESFRFEQQTIYYFNNGCVHSATNHGDSVRYHLVWDMLLTQETVELMFGNAPTPSFLEPIPKEDRHLHVHRRDPIGRYELSPPPSLTYGRLARLGVPKRLLQRAYDSLTYRHFESRGSVGFDHVR